MSRSTLMSSPDFRFELSPKARQDVIDILRYTGQNWGRDQLLVYRDKLDDALKLLGESPHIGNPSDELSQTHRLYYVGSRTNLIWTSPV